MWFIGQIIAPKALFINSRVLFYCSGREFIWIEKKFGCLEGEHDHHSDTHHKRDFVEQNQAKVVEDDAPKG
jgi:hypothetical protein